MPAPPAGQPEITRYRGPARKPARGRPHLGVLHTQYSGGVEFHAEQISGAANVSIIITRRYRKESLFGLRFAAPVKLRKGVKNLQTAHEENDQYNGVHPVSEPSYKVMAVKQNGHGTSLALRRCLYPTPSYTGIDRENVRSRYRLALTPPVGLRHDPFLSVL